MPEKALKTIEKSLFYSKKLLQLWVIGEHTVQTDENLTDRIAKFTNQLQNEFVYRISLKFLCDVSLVNQCFKFNTKYILTLERDMQKLFETNANQAANALPSRC